MPLRRAALVALLAASAALSVLGCKETNLSPTAATSPPPSPVPFTTPYPLVFGSSARGQITVPGQVNLYSFYAIGGTLVELDIDAQAIQPQACPCPPNFNGQEIDARIIVYDTHAGLQAVVDDGTQVSAPPPLDMRDPFLDFHVAPGVVGNGTYVVSVDAKGQGGSSGFDYYLWAKKPAPVPVAAQIACPGALITTNGSYSSSIPAGAHQLFSNGAMNGYAPCVAGYVTGPQVVFQVPSVPEKLQAVVTSTNASFAGKLMVVTQNCPPAPTDCLIGGAGADGASGVVFTPAPAGTPTYLVVQGQLGGSFLLQVKTFAPGQ